MGRIVKVRLARLDEQEEDFYEAMYTQSQAQFNTFVAAGTLLNNYAHIFDILIRLRQVVDHPYLVLHSSNYSNSEFSTALSSAVTSRQGSQVNDEDDDVCGFCHEPVVDLREAKCGHVFCCACVSGYLETLQEGGGDVNESGDEDEDGDRHVHQDTACATCPQCSEPLSLLLGAPRTSNVENGGNFSTSIWDHTKRRRKSFLQKIDLRLFQSSTKMEALMQVGEDLDAAVTVANW